MIEALSAAAGSRITWGVALGLLIGKTVGVSGMAWLAVKLGVARLPRGATSLHMLGISVAAGIGFTVAIFITGISFTDAVLQEDAKIGIFAASIVAATLGAAVFAIANRRASSGTRLLATTERPESVPGDV